MREPYTQVHLHLHWSTWDRVFWLTGEVKAVAYTCIQAECRSLNTELIAIGGIDDHVHLLVRLPMTLSIASLVKQVKGASSHLVTHTVPGAEAFKWQGGYSAFSVSKSDVPRIRDYILRQAEHHRDQTLDADLE